MTQLVPLVMFGWIPLVLGMFVALPTRIAVAAAFVIAWLFLPNASYSFQGFPDYTKISATTAGVLIATILFDPRRLMTYRFHWIDIPIIVWCVAPFMSSVTNGLGAYDGASAVLNAVIAWGLPYFLGRVYFSDLAGAKILCSAILIGGLIYIPLCLYEVRMSPQLHRMVYGYHQHHFIQTMRGDGWRPTVFMQHGLMVGMWMAAAAMVAAWMWAGRSLREVKWAPLSGVFLALAGTTVLCKSFGALILLVASVGVLATVRFLRSPVALVALALAPGGYMAMRTVGGWSGGQLVQAVEMVQPARAASLEFRIDNETMLIDRAMQRKVFGWGGWGRARVANEAGEDISTTDGLWIITFGNNGLIGLAALTAVFLAPPMLFARRIPAKSWLTASVAPAAGLATLIVMYQIDNLFNAMVNPIFLLGVGSVAGIACRVRLAGSQPGRLRADSTQARGRRHGPMIVKGAS